MMLLIKQTAKLAGLKSHRLSANRWLGGPLRAARVTGTRNLLHALRTGAPKVGAANSGPTHQALQRAGVELI